MDRTQLLRREENIAFFLGLLERSSIYAIGSIVEENASLREGHAHRRRSFEEIERNGEVLKAW